MLDEQPVNGFESVKKENTAVCRAEGDLEGKVDWKHSETDHTHTHAHTDKHTK